MSGGAPVDGIRLMRQRHSQGYASSGDDLDDDSCSRMSMGGTPIGGGGGLMRQRFSQEYASSGDDLEDDACLRMAIPRARTWIEVLENVLWIASAIFVVYFGDRRSNFIYLLCHDNRIRRIPLYIGMVGLILNMAILFYTGFLAWGIRKPDENLEVLTPSVAPFVILCALFSFSAFTFALWPIWSFLTLPLLFTLFVACMVIIPYVTVIRSFRPSSSVLRTD